MKKKLILSLGTIICTTTIIGSVVACGKTEEVKKPLTPINFDMQVFIDLGDALNNAKKAAKNNPKIQLKENQFSENEITVFDVKNPKYKNPFSVFLTDMANQIIDELNYNDASLSLNSIEYRTVDTLLNILLKKVKSSEGKSILKIVSGGQSQMLAGLNNFVESFKGIESIKSAASVEDGMNMLSLLNYVLAIPKLKEKNIELNIDYNNKSLVTLALEHGKLSQAYIDRIFYVDKRVDPTTLFIDDMADIGSIVSDGVSLVRTMIEGVGGLYKDNKSFPLSNKMLESFSKKLHMSKVLIKDVQSILRELREMYVTN